MQAVSYYEMLYPNSPMTGLPVEKGGRERPVFMVRSFNGTPRA